MIEKDRVDRRAHRIVAAEAEADIGDAAGDLGVWKMLLDPGGGADEIDRVVRMLFYAGRDCEHVGIDDDVLGRKADLVDEQVVCTASDFDAPLVGVGLTLLVEAHHDRRGAVASDELRLAQELGFALLHRDRIDDGLALHALEAGFDNVPSRRVDHHRHASDIRLGGDQVQEAHHRRLRVEHRLVHVDVDHLRAAADLLARDLDRAGEVAREYQLGESARAGDVGALADVDEEGIVVDGQRLEAGKSHGPRSPWPGFHLIGCVAHDPSCLRMFIYVRCAGSLAPCR